MLSSILQGLAGAAVVLWAVGMVVIAIGVNSRPVLRPPGWPWLLPLWPLLIVPELLKVLRERRRRQALLEAMKRP